MKNILLTTVLLVSSLPALAGESCLSKEEIKVLNDIRSREMSERMRHPECARSWGAAACISPFDQAGKQWLERKENGDPKACAQPKEKSSEEQDSKESEQ